MSRRSDHGMIFIPLLCLLAVLLGCIAFLQLKGNSIPAAAEDPALEVMDIPQTGELGDLVYKPSLDSPSPILMETAPQGDEWVCPLTDEEVKLIALLTMAEAEGEPEYGQRLVIDTVLNRMDSEHFPDSVYDVIYQKNQYSSMTGERVARCWVKEELCELVRSELKERTDYDVVFFRIKHYHSFGVPMFQAGAHYFSKYG